MDPIIWVIAVTCIRGSVIILYLRIFRTRSFGLACYAVLASNIVFLLATVLSDCLICQPIAYRWDRSLSGHCGTQKSLDLFIGVGNLLLDITTVVMPTPVVWRLQIPLSKKAIITVFFGMGVGYVICLFHAAPAKNTKAS